MGVPTPHRVRLCRSEDIGEGQVMRVACDGEADLAVYRHEGRVFASLNRCPHAEAALSDGYLDEGRIVCPVHFAEFELGTGAVFNPPVGCGKLAFFPVEQEGEILFALVDHKVD